ncbi:EmrB/QacA subfamily drug resistance transporter [Alicyclobacillus sacchari]|uniref:EmrB/QacA subfamily drug resistance transporter n=1 Tax=Alicyclobacillus sacchari TaxID=392010 RepID=A0A4R8LUP3_9BACL|nr:MDR family MFS transporter [Alicyclobacillus sacchari]TDY51414.1 EmrB/QacA subfamily drug resistance transporter [Alicyclobacillus sacchari]GMA56757.1 MFS transporter [Alicyclobacillus sacchari]
MNSERSRLGLVIAGLLLGIFVSAMDNTIVATATGNIVAHLGGLDKIVWITAAYMLTEMSGMPIFGKLSDMYGRKRFFAFGLIAFLIGSILCGTAQNMDQLALYRAIQGVGGGALMPIAFTIIFDIVPPEQSGKFSGMFGAVFGIASIFGPLLGAYITEHMSWRWVFYINVPIGIVAFLLVTLGYHESRRHGKQVIDWVGIVTLVPAVASFMFALEFGGAQYPWNSPEIIGGFVVAAVLFAVFLGNERRAREPVVSFHMFRKRAFASSNIVGILSGSAYIVAVVYVPIYIQGVRGGSAMTAGLELLPMMLGSSVTAPVAGQLANRMTYRSVLWPFCVLFFAGIYLLSRLAGTTPTWQLLLVMLMVGFGIGPFFSVIGMAAMGDFDDRNRGAASSTNAFVRELGMAVGIVIYGVVQKHAFESDVAVAFRNLGAYADRLRGMDPRAILTPTTRSQIPVPIVEKLSHAMNASIHTTFVWDLIPAGVTMLAILWMGKARFQGKSATVPASDVKLGELEPNG